MLGPICDASIGDWGLQFVLILVLTSLLARDWFFLFAIIGFVVKVCFRIGSEEMICQFPKTVCFIVGLLSLYLIGITSGFVSLRGLLNSMVCLQI